MVADEVFFPDEDDAKEVYAGWFNPKYPKQLLSGEDILTLKQARENLWDCLRYAFLLNSEGRGIDMGTLENEVRVFWDIEEQKELISNNKT